MPIIVSPGAVSLHESSIVPSQVLPLVAPAIDVHEKNDMAAPGSAASTHAPAMHAWPSRGHEELHGTRHVLSIPHTSAAFAHGFPGVSHVDSAGRRQPLAAPSARQRLFASHSTSALQAVRHTPATHALATHSEDDAHVFPTVLAAPPAAPPDPLEPPFPPPAPEDDAEPEPAPAPAAPARAVVSPPATLTLFSREQARRRVTVSAESRALTG